METTPHEDLDEGRARWREAYDSSTLRDADFETMSGIRLEPVYGPADWPEEGVAERLGWPGRPPYTRGPYASMYRSKLWTMR
ncbi:MAG TPA: methylmalonyl-CoA mutase family protein, partial [Acidimicrobiales bacterium]|nr:methylmalonyl-CoA mutase family protein [Acidimicrobiales bacterium]